jgi:DNA topoisomerase-2
LAYGSGISAGGFNYLLGLKLWTLTYEKVQQLRDQHLKKQEELAEMERKTPKDLWLRDLDTFEEAYTTFVIAALLSVGRKIWLTLARRSLSSKLTSPASLQKETSSLGNQL